MFEILTLLSLTSTTSIRQNLSSLVPSSRSYCRSGQNHGENYPALSSSSRIHPPPCPFQWYSPALRSSRETIFHFLELFLQLRFCIMDKEHPISLMMLTIYKNILFLMFPSVASARSASSCDRSVCRISCVFPGVSFSVHVAAPGWALASAVRPSVA